MDDGNPEVYDWHHTDIYATQEDARAAALEQLELSAANDCKHGPKTMINPDDPDYPYGKIITRGDSYAKVAVDFCDVIFDGFEKIRVHGTFWEDVPDELEANDPD